MTDRHSSSKSTGPNAWPGAEKWLKVILLLLAACVVYFPAMRGGFVWDDGTLLVNNPLVKSGDGLFRMWFSADNWDYFPITYSSFWLEWHLWGRDPAGYHVLNILLHAANAVLVWRVLLRLGVRGPWLAALIFAVHPVNTASVAWIAERKNTLSMLFYMAAVLGYLRFEIDGKQSRYFLALGMFLLALLSKTSVVMLPVVLLLCCWWQRQKITRRDLIRTIPFFFLSLATGLATIWFQNHRAIRESVIPMGGFLQRVAGAGCAACFYILKIFVPLNLSMLYPHWDIRVSWFPWFLPGALVLSVFVTAWRFQKTWGRPVLFGLGYFAISLLPVLGFLKMYYMRYSLVADQWLYLPMIGMAGLASAASVTLTLRMGWRLPGKIAAAAIVVALGTLTWERSLLFKDEQVFWDDVARKDPGSVPAHVNLALYFLQHGAADEALAHARKAVSIDGSDVEANLDLAVILQKMGRFDEAISLYRKGLELRPGNPGAHLYIGIAQERCNRPEEAIAEFRQALELDPKFERARLKLAMALYQRGRLDEAAAQFREILKSNPGSVEGHNSLGSTLYKQGHIDQAIAEYEEALKISPSDPNIRRNLDTMLRIKRESVPR